MGGGEWLVGGLRESGKESIVASEYLHKRLPKREESNQHHQDSTPTQ